MAITGAQKPLGDFLSQKKQYIIPRYQRGYVWEEKQWVQMFNDLKSNFERGVSEGHFIGSVVIYDQTQENPIKSNVIDGQQRITTFLILVLAMMRKANLLNNRDLFDGLKLYMKTQTPAGLKYDKFYNEHNPFFKELLDLCSEWTDNIDNIENNKDLIKKNYQFEEKFIKNCFFKLYSLLDNAILNGMDLPRFADKVMSTVVIETISTDIKESYTVFEILNARGKPLENFELIKNFIMRNYESEGSPDEALVKWNKLYNSLIENKIVPRDFFDHYVSYKYKKDFQTKNKTKYTTYDYVKMNNAEDTSKNFLDDLVYIVNHYILISNPDISLILNYGNLSKILKDSLVFFKGRGKKQFRPLFIALFDRFYNKGDTAEEKEENFKLLVDIARFLEDFYFVYGIVLRFPSRQFEKIVHEIAYGISSCLNNELLERINKLKITFSSLLPDYTTFENAFCNLGYSKKNIRYGDEEGNKEDVKYVLTKYEQYLRGNNHDIERFSIEHIHKDTGSDTYCKIGNLMPLEEELNNRLDDKPVSAKISAYKSSVFDSARKIGVDYNGSWNKTEIDARGKYLANLLYHSVWVSAKSSEN